MKSFVKYAIFIGLLGVGWFVCKSGDFSEDQSEKTNKPEGVTSDSLREVYSLKKEHFYNTYQVKKARKEATEEAKKQGKEKYDRALFACTEDHELRKGEALLVESILHYPDGVAYFELGNLYIQLKNYEEAIETYKMAKQLDYKPLSDLHYNMSCAFALDDSDFDGKRRALGQLRMAVKEGYANKAFFLGDKRLENIRYSYEYNKIYLQAFAKKEKYLEQEKLELFINLFPKVEFPLEIEVGELSEQLDTERRLYDPLLPYISKDIMEEEHFILVAFLKKTPRYTAVVYAGYPTQPEEESYRYYTIATYSPTGKRIDKLNLASSINPEKHLSGIVDEKLNIEVKIHQNIWEKSPKKYGYKNNRIEYPEFLFSNYYRIDSKGRFVRTKKKLLNTNE